MKSAKLSAPSWRILAFQGLRYGSALLIALGLLAFSSASYPVSASDYAGLWKGTYVCRQGRTNVSVNVLPGTAAGGFPATIKFWSDDKSSKKSGEYQAELTVDARGNAIFRPTNWTVRPDGYVMVPFKGSFSADAKIFAGRVDGAQCAEVSISREDVTPSSNALSSRPPLAAPAPATNAPVQTARATPAPSRSPEDDRKALIQRADLSGRWDGLARCRNDWLNISYVLIRDGADYEVVEEAETRAAYRFNLNEKSTAYAYQKLRPTSGPIPRSVGSTINRIFPTEHRPTYLEIGPGADCYLVAVRRFDRLPGLGGQYAAWGNFADACIGIRGWLAGSEEENKIARDLKTRHSRILENYAVDESVAYSTFSAKRTQELFGRPLSDLSEAEQRQILQLVNDCYVLRSPSQSTRSATFLLLGSRKITVMVRNLSFKVGASFSPDMAQVSKDEIESARSVLGSISKSEKAISDALVGLSGNETDVKTRMNGVSRHFSQVSPSFLRQNIDTIASVIEARRVNATAQDRAKKKEAVAALFATTPIPRGLFPPEQAATIDKLMTGSLTRMSTADIIFLAGSSYELLKSCKFSISATDLAQILQLQEAAKQRVGMGINFESFDFADKTRDQSSAVLTLLMGTRFGKALECSPYAAAFLTATAYAMELNASDGGGGDSIFVRTCAVTYNRSRCGCLADVGRAVYPDIHNSEFSRGIIGGIIRNNPIVGMKIAMQCGINNY